MWWWLAGFLTGLLIGGALTIWAFHFGILTLRH